GGLPRVCPGLWIQAGFLFFLGWAYVGLMLFGRAAARSRATSLRAVLGASRGTLARAALFDSIVICCAGGALGGLLAVWTSRIIPALLFEQDAQLLVLAPDVFTTVAASATGAGIICACGLLP